MHPYKLMARHLWGVFFTVGLKMPENAGTSENFLGEGLGISGESVNFAVA